MKNIKITLEYNGTHFKGWQIQGKGERTVCGELKKALKKLTQENITIIGSGRTDSGVHAQGQVANFNTTSNIDIKQWPKALNAKIPTDIAITAAEEVQKDFHAQHKAKEKTYTYTILNQKYRSALHKETSLHIAHKLNVAAMKREAKFLTGRKDFKSFQANDPSKPHRSKDTIRTLKEVKIQKSGKFITISMTSNGFLYKMCRNIVGTLLEVGSGKLEEGSIKKILKNRDRSLSPATAKAHGLCLLTVTY